MTEENKGIIRERMRDEQLAAQSVAAAVQGINQFRDAALHSQLDQQEAALRSALEELGKVRDFVANPRGILGSGGSKHGEIAEFLEVHGRNARDLLHGRAPTASMATDRFGPADFIVDGVAIQSKFINGLNNNLKHLQNHMHKYPEWGVQGEQFYIPRDHFEHINRVLSGENPLGLSSRTINAVHENVARIEQLTGKPYNQVVQPSNSNYAEVMPGKIDATLGGRESELRAENEELNSGIREAAAPSLGKGVQTAAGAAAIAAGIAFGAGVYQKWRAGKNPFEGDFTADDWKDVGVASGQTAAVAGVSTFTIYCLTNFAKTSAPLAAAYVGAAANVFTLVKSNQAGIITAAEVAELAPLACIEAAAVALASAAGQVIIPIPVVGMMLGALAARMCLKFLPDQDSYLAAKAELAQYYERAQAKIRETEASALEMILTEYDQLGNLTEAAFDYSRNYALLLQASVQMAEAYKVPTTKILRGTDDTDSFML